MGHHNEQLMIVISIIDDPLDAIIQSLRREITDLNKELTVVELDNFSETDLISSALKGAMISKSRFLFHVAQDSPELEKLLPLLGFLARNKETPVFVIGNSDNLDKLLKQFRLEYNRISRLQEALQ